MDSRKNFFLRAAARHAACLALLLGCALPAGAAGNEQFQSSIRAPLSAAQAAELRAATEAASFSAQASRGTQIAVAGNAAQGQAQPSTYRLNAALPLQPSRLIPVSAIPEAPGWMVFLVCIIVALFVARRASGPRG